MKYTIQKEKGRPAYWQLYAQLRDDITAGRYPPGSRLPVSYTHLTLPTILRV